ncbi:TetR/AcrR family transcriptional regulator [Aestuariibaculum suncheonense]|uniref:TetR/AcrR family transcriptional regulator n=1 Tax=Aestuariibaculum suncheonense TaxID=1028745 RepID=A0A8J6UBR7_9FLAO|nr:TetR/AcrR family transcriptional regulator [Aestuariibaculum suncheonense]MBD0836518.1 TetR/AcrR family transcriptional regulator [Aestuariibaculum suncheonense]
MTTKQEVLECSVSNFTKFGSKRFTMDELASELGISKKTIYKFFDSKEDLVIQCVELLIKNYKDEIESLQGNDNSDPITSIIFIYKKAFQHIAHFKPSFIFGLKKYYPKANLIFDEFRTYILDNIIFPLLEKAQTEGIIRPEVNLRLFCDLYFVRFEEIALKNNTFFDKYTNEELLKHFVIYNLRGITSEDYKLDFE